MTSNKSLNLLWYNLHLTVIWLTVNAYDKRLKFVVTEPTMHVFVQRYLPLSASRRTEIGL